MHIERIFDILPFAHEKYHKEIALAGKKNGKWQTYNSQEYIDNSNYVSSALMGLGIKKGDAVINISVNRPEWNFIDMGILQLGAIHVPVFPTINIDDLANIIVETEAKIIFFSGKFLTKKMLEFKEQHDFLQHIISLDKIKDVPFFNNLLEKGKATYNDERIQQAKNAVFPDDVASILYTSGTTNSPKGVMLSHRNHLTTVKIVADTICLDSNMSNLSYLPLSHSYERMVNYTGQFLGVSMYYNENLANILANFKDVQPNILVTVPLLLEKIYQGILDKGEHLKGIQKMIFKWAVNLGLKFELGKKHSSLYNQQLKLANKLVFSKWRDALGGKMNKIIVGGASLQREIYNVFWAAQIPVYEGYGLTETSPLVSYNTENFNKPGTLGKTLFNVITKVDKDGELLVKAGNVMLGYYKHPELTQEVIDKDGWLHTGDIAEIDEDGYILITGRKKDAFKTAAGTFVYPEAIENKLKLSPFLDQILVAGANKKHLVGIVVPNMTYLLNWAQEHEIEFRNESDLCENPKIKEAILRTFNDYNQSAKEGQKVLNIEVLPEAWTIEKSEITPSMKIRRMKLLKKYNQQIENLYIN